MTVALRARPRGVRAGFQQVVDRGLLTSYSLEVEDLQEVAILEKRRHLSKGELAAIAFAAKTKQAFLTDDQRARKLATSVMERSHVQTTPHLLGWLGFVGRVQRQREFAGARKREMRLDERANPGRAWA